MSAEQANSFDVVVPSSGDSVEAETLEAALAAARQLQREAADEHGIAAPVAIVYYQGRHYRTLTRMGGRP